MWPISVTAQTRTITRTTPPSWSVPTRWWLQPQQATCRDATLIRHPCPSPGEWQSLESHQAQAKSPARSYLLQHLLFQFYIYGISQDDMDMKFNWWLNCSTPSLMILTSTVEKFKSKHRGIEHRGLQEMPFWRTSIYMNKVVSC